MGSIRLVVDLNVELLVETQNRIRRGQAYETAQVRNRKPRKKGMKLNIFRGFIYNLNALFFFKTKTRSNSCAN